jgi:hypothetical protein
LGLLAAILAGVLVTQENLFLGQFAGSEGPLDQVNQANDGRDFKHGIDGMHLSPVIFQQLGLPFA